MKQKIFSVYDSKVGAYMSPLFMQSTGMAMRSFEDTCNDENHTFYKHASDYTLFELGTFNDADCSFELLKAPIPLAKAFEVIDKELKQVPNMLKNQAS